MSVQLTGSPSATPGPNQYVAGNFLISVNFDLSDIIAPATDWSVPLVRYNGDTNNVPFGLTVSFDPL